ncbi:MAG: LysR family transcriptional regulator [Atopobiaceae bacterium]|jgi:DNA-binding transcriptional LysR family regulator|nr:LysR family transcriptional regulator [Atopobiaceae bacterium]MCH4180268.1 LysR family transcriptional regulator [Atopobiaceae bacterium]MCH4214754.1 LysR family transcriptional regulator [Atopobiaceae bacterium]MCH4229980.1 LysR family transcriptional regulator [Atopobiaceae bacterium]MCH4276937.1 LysR family transcriptional regulator [Atopobiaceae bacterium]
MRVAQLETFVMLGETLSFSTTAQNLFMAQSSVSHQIDALERELGFALFYRNRHSVRLTPAGASLHEDARDVLVTLDSSIAKARNYAREYRGSLSVSYEGNVWETDILPQVISRCTRQCPDTYIQLRMEDNASRIRRLRNHERDVIFTVADKGPSRDGVCFQPLLDASLVCLMPASNPLAGRKSLVATDVIDQALIVLDPSKSPPEMLRLYATLQAECPGAIMYYADSATAACTMIRGGLGVAIMPDFEADLDPGLALVPFDSDEHLCYGIAWHHSEATDGIRAFVQAARTVCGVTGQTVPG